MALFSKRFLSVFWSASCLNAASSSQWLLSQTRCLRMAVAISPTSASELM
jgi:hypothetical protein